MVSRRPVDRAGTGSGTWTPLSFASMSRYSIMCFASRS